MKLSLIFGSLLLSSLIGVNASEYSLNRLVVKLKNGESFSKTPEMTSAKNLFGNTYVVYTKENVATLINKLNNSQKFEYVQFDYKSEKRDLPKLEEVEKDFELNKSSDEFDQFNDPKTSNIWSFNDASSNGVSVNKAYQTYGGENKSEVIVAVVDTGVDYNHEDLKDVMWVNAGEIPGNGIDDDQNGYIDDVYGINTLKRDSNGNATGNPMDTHSHGTHVSGTIGATQNNGVGISGIASNVKIMAIRTVPNSGDETDVDVVESFIYAAKNGAKIINCSFGKDRNEGGMVVKEAIDHIGKEYGVLVVAAAGNSSRDIDSRPTYPASFESENLLVVASTTSRGSLSYFSNYGRKNVDLAAPGSSVYSTTPNNRYGSMSGTSMASPTTAGVAAEVLSQHPELSPVELKAVLMNTGTKSRSYQSTQSGGRVDLFNALSSLK